MFYNVSCIILYLLQTFVFAIMLKVIKQLITGNDFYDRIKKGYIKLYSFN